MSLTSQKFDALMTRAFGARFDHVDALAVGVSGGPDSMALLLLLQAWCASRDKGLHALSVDHGLREAAAKECADVGVYCERFDHVHHKVLKWESPSAARVQEEARRARYDLMSQYCTAHGVQYLFLAHHAGDQAETVLFRLSKGSGVQGLGGMRAVQERGDLVLCRPFLDVEKQDLIVLCESGDVPYAIDPSNDDGQYARVRLRQSMDILGNEGLTQKRLSITASRIRNANEVIDNAVENEILECKIYNDTNRIEYSKKICDGFVEVLVRVILRGVASLGAPRDYAPRLEKVEDLAFALKDDAVFRKRTLGGVVFERDDDAAKFVMTREKTAD